MQKEGKLVGNEEPRNRVSQNEFKREEGGSKVGKWIILPVVFTTANEKLFSLLTLIPDRLQKVAVFLETFGVVRIYLQTTQIVFLSHVVIATLFHKLGKTQ